MEANRIEVHKIDIAGKYLLFVEGSEIGNVEEFQQMLYEWIMNEDIPIFTVCLRDGTNVRLEKLENVKETSQDPTAK